MPFNQLSVISLFRIWPHVNIVMCSYFGVYDSFNRCLMDIPPRCKISTSMFPKKTFVTFTSSKRQSFHSGLFVKHFSSVFCTIIDHWCFRYFFLGKHFIFVDVLLMYIQIRIIHSLLKNVPLARKLDQFICKANWSLM